MKWKTMAKKTKRKLKIIPVILLFSAVLVIAALGFFKLSLGPVGDDIHSEFTVVKGDTVNSVLSRLEEEGLISSKLAAKVYVKLSSDVSLKAGTYDLDGYMDVKTILATLSDASKAHSEDVYVTIIEGEWVKHIAASMANYFDVTEEELLTLWNDEDYVRSLMSDYPFLTEEIFNEDSRFLLEGYLMPNTYAFKKDSDADEITRRFLDQTLSVYNKYQDEIAASDLSIHELFTLSSIVQYEAGKVEDMKLIAGVFYNRIAAGMKLQSSVTVCYALDMEKDDDWKNCETNPEYPSMYNTYWVKGLPPGPILNPGEAALEATLNPTDSEYYYFLADVYGDGTVYYSKTYDQHLAYKRKYLD